MSWPQVAVHMHLLPNGNVMTWSRSDEEDSSTAEARIWDPAANTFTVVEDPYNFFCSGHSFMADGRLLVTGGHTVPDGYQMLSYGLPNTSIFDSSTNTWTRVEDMNAGRWYPTNATLASGEVLVVAGETTPAVMNKVPQVWQNGGGWQSLTTAEVPFANPWYPWLYQAPNGSVFHAGPDQTTHYLSTTGTGAWTVVGNRTVASRPEGTSVMYAPGKILALGGGGRSPNGVPPTATAEVIDLNTATPAWRAVAPMALGRRQVSATLLADGKVLVTGGTSKAGWNDGTGKVLAAELWDPATESFTTLADMVVYRGYHSTALLLPDGRVLSAGGEGGQPFQHQDAEIFSPPYLFNADGSLATRPTITAAPTTLAYGQQFFVQTPDAANIAKVSLIRHSSVTHSFNTDQHISDLSFTPVAGGLNITAPASGNLAPPGYSMLFILDGNGVPSVAKTLNLSAASPIDTGFAVSAGQGGASPNDEGRAVVVDTGGNTYVAGTYLYADGNFDSTAAGSADIFVAKYGPDGTLLWQHTIGSSGDQRARAIARDSAGNIYVTGAFQGTVDFDPAGGLANLTSAGGFDIFVLKLSSDGVYQWSQKFGGSSSTADIGYGIALDSADDVLVTGQFGGTVDFNPTSATLNLASAGGSDIFVLKLNSNRGFVWAKRMGGSATDRGTAVTTDSLNGVYTTGSFSGTADFNPGSAVNNLTSAGSTDVFVSGLSSSGGFLFAKRLGGSAADEAHDIELDPTGNIYTTGYFSGTADFNPGSGVNNLTSAGGTDVFLSKLAANAGHGFVFAKRIGGSSDDRARGLVIATNGNVALTGHFTSTVDFDPNAGVSNLASAGSTDAFVLQVSSLGNFVIARRLGGSGLDAARGIARDSKDSLYVTGFYTVTATFDTGTGPLTLTSSGGKDIFVTKIVASSGSVLSSVAESRGGSRKGASSAAERVRHGRAISALDRVIEELLRS